MKLQAFALAGLAGSVLVAGTATADFVDVTFTSSVGATGRTTYRYFANFDNAADSVLAVSGTAAQPVVFSTNTVLFNNGGGFDGVKQEDFAQFPISGADDSWVTVGADGFAGNNTDYSPGFLNNVGLAVIVGSSWSDDNDGWFNSNPGEPQFGPSVLIGQFTVDNDGSGAAGTVSLAGNVDWTSAAGDLMSNTFGAAPAPGALALLGIAGLAGRRRRRA